jgi:hypothetical protein
MTPDRLAKLAALATLLLTACGSDYAKNANDGIRVPSREQSEEPGEEGAADESPPPVEKPAPSGDLDTDGDGIADALDCDPASADLKGEKLLDDPMSADTAAFTPAAGFVAANWAYQDAAYRQLRLANASDATFFTKDPTPIDALEFSVKAASTDITNAITPVLRQMFILIGAKSEEGTFTSYGCGAEVVQGMTPTQRTSVVKLSGPANGTIVTTPLMRTPRPLFQENEDFTIRARLTKAGEITCTIVNGADNVTVATATVADAVGATGFFTRQTKAAFKTVKVCRLK